MKKHPNPPHYVSDVIMNAFISHAKHYDYEPEPNFHEGLKITQLIPQLIPQSIPLLNPNTGLQIGDNISLDPRQTIKN